MEARDCPQDCQFGAGTRTLQVCAGYFQQRMPDVTGLQSLEPAPPDSNSCINELGRPDWLTGIGQRQPEKQLRPALLQNTVDFMSGLTWSPQVIDLFEYSKIILD